MEYPKEFVDKERIEIDPPDAKEGIGEYRYSLKIPFIEKNRNECIIVIMMNPSKADKCKTDRTVYDVLKYVHDDNVELRNVGTVIILNLIPYYKTKSFELEIKLDEENMKKINKYKDKNIDKIILGWGKPVGIKKGTKKEKEYQNIIEKVLTLELLKNKIKEKKVFKVDELTKDGYPRHPNPRRNAWKGKKLCVVKDDLLCQFHKNK